MYSVLYALSLDGSTDGPVHHVFICADNEIEVVSKCWKEYQISNNSIISIKPHIFY